MLWFLLHAMCLLEAPICKWVSCTSFQPRILRTLAYQFPKKGSDPPTKINKSLIYSYVSYVSIWNGTAQSVGWRQHKNIEDVWTERGGAQAYLGIAVDQFPNFFMLFGPNTATGYTSVIFATENAVNYSLNFIKPIFEGNVSSYEIKEEAERAWTKEVQDQLQKTVFRRGVCSSWYITADGWNSSTYP
jgi:hypothetical protein